MTDFTEQDLSDSTFEKVLLRRATFRDVSFAEASFTDVDLTDNWLRIGDLDDARLQQLADVLARAGLAPIAVSAIRRSVIDPEDGEDNLAYSHRVLEAAKKLGSRVVSFGLHRPLSPEQQEAFWFWTAPGPVDATDDATWQLAVTRLRELGSHAAELGLQLSLELVHVCGQRRLDAFHVELLPERLLDLVHVVLHGPGVGAGLLLAPDPRQENAQGPIAHAVPEEQEVAL